MESDFFRGCWDKNMQVVPVEQPIRGEVMEKKIAIPEGMVKAVDDAISKARGIGRDLMAGQVEQITLEAALLWLSENPIVPTKEQANDLWKATNGALKDMWPILIITEWQRIMFRALEPSVLKDGTVEYRAGTTRPVAIWWDSYRWPIETTSNHSEPEVPEAVKDLWWASPTPDTKRRIIEAYRRGKAAK